MIGGNAKGFGTGTSFGSGALERVTSDTHLAILSVFSTIASLAIGSFAVYRLIHGEFIVALFDSLLVAAMLGGLVYAWKTGRSALVGNLVATLLAVGTLFMIFVLGLSHLWLFSLMIALFLMASRVVSIALSLLLVAVVGNGTEVFTDPVERVTFLVVAVQVAVFSFVFAWRTSHQHRQLHVMANRDPLTGIGNRRALRREMARRAEAARMSSERAALALIDLDHFKKVNDRHGHDAGDKVLVDLAGIVSDTMRACDSFYRYGGEEFVLVMPGTPLEGIVPALEKLQGAIHERLRGPDGPLTVSIGAAGLKADEESQKWLSRADRALYVAKSDGRDRVCIDQE
ncbi:diguanylate cyclase [Haliea sp. E1-2-M8]|uniref:diguanylate cyclase n=1 Tax=Haliea sp. E1-2-M8 TaxID=3064706 RepID=UPI00271F975C|nr:diguanylate cyclase [Haliea sp. E1-2-M8]MDO8863199.1 diguanylate cyclase [Haliea sp. E1-2-M8]